MTISFSLFKHNCTVSGRSADIVIPGEREGKGGRRKKRRGSVSALRKGGVRHRERAAEALQIKSSFPEKLCVTLFTAINVYISFTSRCTFVFRLKVWAKRQGASSVLCCFYKAHIGQREKTREKRKKSAEQFLEFHVKKPRVCLQQASVSEREESLTRRGQKSFTTAELVSGSRLMYSFLSLFGSMKFCEPKKRGEESCKM